MSSASENDADGPQYHPEFYFQDGSAIFKVDGMLYKLHPGLLANRSIFFASMFSLPRGPHNSEMILSEGKIDTNAIELPSCISQQDFDNLLSYLYSGPSTHPKTEEFFVSVMKLAAMFEIPDGIEHTKNELARLDPPVHPALQFELARCFRIDEWVEPAFRRLMDTDLVSLDSFEVAQIGHHGYFWLTRTKAKIQALRVNIAFNVPPIINISTCDTPGTCMYSWTREWEESVRQLIHHPDKPISCLDLLDQLRNTHIDGLCDGCQDLTVRWIWGKSLLTQEEDCVEEAIAALMELQTDQPLRAALSASVAGRIVV
ncbi:hypothetical protein DFH09DRAFT_1052157 [Mycena vulgaris]|nr:hypothetical protein DFH09DRAFT_1052157 [Mycena vulgaris]